MGSNIHCIPLNNEIKKYFKNINHNIIFTQEKQKDLSYYDLQIIVEKLKKWGWLIEGYSPTVKEYDLFISKEIDGDKGKNLYMMIWIKEIAGKPKLHFHKGRHSIGLFIAREIAKLCGTQCVFEDEGEIHIVTREMDLTWLMENWLEENLYSDLWQKSIE